MLVYVLHKDGHPLMPTKRNGKVRHLLEEGKAKVVCREPFTIRLTYESGSYVQPVDLGVDAGSKTAGLSACTDTEELYAAEAELRSDITKNLSERREYRRSRRYRKTRYRKPRFSNRTASKEKGWLAPSVEAKISEHIRAIEKVCSILPIRKITVETASFDTQKLKAELEGREKPQGKEYQQGDQLGFWNVREYVLFRDGHSCRCCHGKSGDSILNVHHIESRQTGGDAPGNLVTLCETCHKRYHAGEIGLPSDIGKQPSFRDAAFMGIMRWTLYNRLKAMYPGKVFNTFGYITKNTRINHGVTKTHAADARCISGHPDAAPLPYYYYLKFVRRHNRQLHKSNILKGGIRKLNQAPKYVRGFCLFDKVLFNGTECFVFGRRSSGYFDLRLLDGKKIHSSANVRDIQLLEHAKTILTERRRKQGEA